MKEADIRELFAYNLKKTRKSLHISQAQLAEKIDRSVTFVSDLEQGKKGFSLHTLAKLCSAMEIEAAVLFLPKDWSNSSDSNISSIFNEIKEILRSVEAKYYIKPSKNQ